MKWIPIIAAASACLIALMALVGATLPVKHSISRSAHFNMTPEDLYRLISAPPIWRSQENRRGRIIVYELVEDRPPTRRVVRIAGKDLPFGGSWTMEILPEGEGASVRITEEGEIYNPLFRFMARYLMGYARTIDGWLNELRNVEKAGMLPHNRPSL